MLFKLFLFTVFLYQTTDATKHKQNKNVSFSLEKIWQSYQKCKSDKSVEPDWICGVQAHYDGCSKAAKKFRGPSNEIAVVVVNGFREYLTKIVYCANSETKVVKSNAVAILEALKKGNKLSGSSSRITKEFYKFCPGLVKSCNKIVTNLKDVLGDLTCSFNDELNAFTSEFLKNLEAFLECHTTECRKDVEFKPVVKQFQKYLNTLALIAETLLNECESAKREDYEAVTVLTLISYYFVLSVQGINSCAQDIVFDPKCSDLSKDIEPLSTSLGHVVVGTVEALSSVDVTSVKSMKRTLAGIVKIVIAFNESVEGIFGVFKGVDINVGEIIKNISKGTVKSGKENKRNTLKGVHHE